MNAFSRLADAPNKAYPALMSRLRRLVLSDQCSFAGWPIHGTHGKAGRVHRAGFFAEFTVSPFAVLWRFDVERIGSE